MAEILQKTVSHSIHSFVPIFEDSFVLGLKPGKDDQSDPFVTTLKNRNRGGSGRSAKERRFLPKGRTLDFAHQSGGDLGLLRKVFDFPDRQPIFVLCHFVKGEERMTDRNAPLVPVEDSDLD
jgi:hypothetical protein